MNAGATGTGLLRAGVVVDTVDLALAARQAVFCVDTTVPDAGVGRTRVAVVTIDMGETTAWHQGLVTPMVETLEVRTWVAVITLFGRLATRDGARRRVGVEHVPTDEVIATGVQRAGVGVIAVLVGLAGKWRYRATGRCATIGASGRTRRAFGTIASQAELARAVETQVAVAVITVDTGSAGAGVATDARRAIDHRLAGDLRGLGRRIAARRDHQPEQPDRDEGDLLYGQHAEMSAQQSPNCLHCESHWHWAPALYLPH
jgi:hypothetical protein